jgi:hypothetical protein
MIIDMVPLANDYIFSQYEIAGLPTCYFDGGYRTLMAGGTYTSLYLSRIQDCGQREVHDLDLSISITWLGNASVEITVNVTSNQFINTTPYTPSAPDGIDTGVVGIEYIFTSTATDPEDQQLYYLWDWGDGQTSEWLGPFNSGDITCGIGETGKRANGWGHSIPARFQTLHTPGPITEHSILPSWLRMNWGWKAVGRMPEQ